MPITKGAKKKMRQDEKRRQQNLRIKKIYKTAVKEVRQKPTKASLKKAYSTKSLKKAYSALDKAVKKGVIKKGKASRLKSRLARLP